MDKKALAEYMINANKKFLEFIDKPEKNQDKLPRLDAKAQEMKTYLEKNPFGCHNSQAVKFAEILLGPLNVNTDRGSDSLLDLTGATTLGVAIVNDEDQVVVLSDQLDPEDPTQLDDCVNWAEDSYNQCFSIDLRIDHVASEDEINEFVKLLSDRDARMIAAALNLK